MLTALELKSMATPAKMIEIADDPEAFPGLRIRVSPTGLITFFHRFRDPLKANNLTKRTLGRYPEVSLKEARKLWAHSQETIGQEPEPSADSDPGLLEQPQSSILGEALVRAYVSWKSQHVKSWKVDDNNLKAEFLPALGSTPIADITRADIRGILNSIEARGAMVRRNRIFASIRSMFNWAIDNEYVDTSPCTGIKQLNEKSRDRVLTDREIKRLYLESSMVDKVEGVYFNLYFFMLLTACRVNEACTMEWSELDLTAERPTWTIPGEKSKNGKPHMVFLSKRAIRILESREKRGEYVWTASRHVHRGVKHLSAATASRKAQDIVRQLKMDHWTPHDLRRTCATGMARIGFSNEVIDRALNHTPTGISAVYNRHRYDDEVFQAWTKWEESVVKICS